MANTDAQHDVIVIGAGITNAPVHAACVQGEDEVDNGPKRLNEIVS